MDGLGTEIDRDSVEVDGGWKVRVQRMMGESIYSVVEYSGGS